MSHIIPDWTDIFHDLLLVEKMSLLDYTVKSATARVFRIDNAKLISLKSKID